jgi:hypothetical protein
MRIGAILILFCCYMALGMVFSTLDAGLRTGLTRETLIVAFCFTVLILVCGCHTFWLIQSYRDPLKGGKASGSKTSLDRRLRYIHRA